MLGQLTALMKWLTSTMQKKGVKLFQSGFFIDMQYPYLGASPGRIQVFKCCLDTFGGQEHF